MESMKPTEMEQFRSDHHGNTSDKGDIFLGRIPNKKRLEVSIIKTPYKT
jgi:hypothetical protein